jgi:hypothetical protein
MAQEPLAEVYNRDWARVVALMEVGPGRQEQQVVSKQPRAGSRW